MTQTTTQIKTVRSARSLLPTLFIFLLFLAAILATIARPAENPSPPASKAAPTSASNPPSVPKYTGPSPLTEHERDSFLRIAATLDKDSALIAKDQAATQLLQQEQKEAVEEQKKVTQERQDLFISICARAGIPREQVMANQCGVNAEMKDPNGNVVGQVYWVNPPTAALATPTSTTPPASKKGK